MKFLIAVFLPASPFILTSQFINFRDICQTPRLWFWPKFTSLPVYSALPFCLKLESRQKTAVKKFSKKLCCFFIHIFFLKSLCNLRIFYCSVFWCKVLKPWIFLFVWSCIHSIGILFFAVRKYVDLVVISNKKGKKLLWYLYKTTKVACIKYLTLVWPLKFSYSIAEKFIHFTISWRDQTQWNF